VKHKKYSLHIKFMPRNIVKVDLIFWFLAFTNLVLVFWEWKRRHNSLIGLSDEGHLYSQLRASKQFDPNASLFAEILSTPYGWLDGSTIKYRIFGLTIVMALAIFTFVMVWKISLVKNDEYTSSFIAIVCSIPVLLIPSTFRYLLMSPGYQWLITITSVVAFIFLFKLSTSKLVTSKQLAFMCVPLFFVLQISLYTRPTYFFLLYMIMFISLYFLKGRRKFTFLVFLLATLVFLFATQSNLIEKWSDVISNANLIDPNGYSILNEFIDVGVSLFLVASAIIAGNILFNSKMKPSRNKILVPTTMVIAILILVIWTIISRDRLAPFIFLSAILLGRFLPSIRLIRAQKFNFIYLLLLSSLPITSQFGSNVPALANSNLALISLIFLFLIFIKTSDVKITHFKVVLSCLLSLILAMQLVNTERSFETSLNQSSVATVMGEVLNTSDAISRNLFLFQSYFDKAQVPQKEKIMDLSFFHPGGGLYLSREVIPRGTVNETFRETFNKQVEIILEEYPEHFEGDYGLVMVSFPPRKDPIPLNACIRLKDWLQFQMQKSPVIDSKILGVNYRVLSVLNSDVEQKNLFPNKLLVLSKCG
jgi:hypothetical protein